MQQIVESIALGLGLVVIAGTSLEIVAKWRKWRSARRFAARHMTR